MRVAIVGGGVGGLAVAFNLIKNWPAGNGAPPQVTVYEASSRFGGNGDTVDFTLGIQPTIPAPGLYNRWADLGVNDFNKTAYVHIAAVMAEIDYTAYSPLEDSTSYYTADGSIAYASGNSLFVSPMTAMPDPLSAAVNAFMTQAAQDVNNPAYASLTIREYLETVFSQNAAYDPRLGPQVIFPRVNGMYFTDEVAPSELPFIAVMHYYAIQEGAGGSPAQRMYFVNGASNWINALVSYMQTQLGVTFVNNFPVALDYANEVWTLTNTTPGPPVSVQADVVVVATHADDAAKLIRSGASTDVMSLLGRIKYLNGVSVAHTFAGLLPSDYNAWCTYNILIRPEATSLKPYSITYVCNRHQNDGANPSYAYFGWPQFFVTVNPPVPIPSQYVLTDVSGAPAVANLRHNVLNFDCLDAQNGILAHQGANGLYFAGGWTKGAGLHEECWIQGIDIAAAIATKTVSRDNHYDAARGPGKFAPLYLRRMLGRE